MFIAAEEKALSRHVLGQAIMKAEADMGRDQDRTPLPFNWFTLRFDDGAMEHAFASEAVEHTIVFARIFMVFGIAAYAFFGVLDHILITDPDALTRVTYIRFLTVLPVMALSTMLTFRRKAQPFIEGILTVCFLASGGGIIAMTAVVGDPVNYLYYGGVTLIVIYGASLIQLRFTYSLGILIALLAGYVSVTLLLNAIPVWAQINNVAFLGGAVALCSFSKYVQEYYVRRAFSNRMLLSAEKAESDRLRIEAEAASLAKSKFLAVMSHELRTPLNAVIGFSDIMRREMLGPIGSDQYREYAEDINQSGHHLLGIIADILDLSRAEMGKLNLQVDEFDLAETAEQAIRMLSSQADEKGVTLDLEDLPGKLALEADVRLIKQVLINLAMNAIKFTDAGGSVTVTAGVDEEAHPYFRVTDTGIGIAPENLDSVLQPFVQVESAMTRQNGGAGIGLPLSKKIVELHEGTLALESAVGRGTTVTVTLPKSCLVSHTAQREPQELLAAS